MKRNQRGVRRSPVRERERFAAADDMGLSSAVLQLHLRRLDRFLKRQGFHRAAHTLERESLARFDAAHLQKLVREGRWSAAYRYLGCFSPLWEPEGEGTNQQYTALMKNLRHNSMLAFLACRGEEGGRDARRYFSRNSLVYPSDEDFRTKFHDVIKCNELYSSMESAEARASVDWDKIKLTTLDMIQELLHLRPDLDCSLRMRLPQLVPTPLEIIPLGLRGPRRNQRKRTEHKPAHQIAHFLLQKRLSSTQRKKNPGDSGAKLLIGVHLETRELEDMKQNDTSVAAGISGGVSFDEVEDEASKSKSLG